MTRRKGNPVYDLNRPVHLARSVVFLEKARELFQESIKKIPKKRCAQLIDGSLYFLQSALDHATLASKSTRTNLLEDSFVTFSRMMVIYLYSARLLLNAELELDDTKSPLWQFLHLNGKAKRLVRFARSGEQLLDDVSHLFIVSREPFEDLQKSIWESLTAEDQTRFKLARDELRGHLAQSHQIPRAERFFQIFSPVPEMKNGL